MKEKIENSNQEQTSEQKTKPKGRRAGKILKRTLKVTGWLVLAVVLLVAAALGCVVWLLTPERLTPIVENLANENLQGEVKIGRVELTVWETFPQASLDVQRVEVTTAGFAKANRLPAGSDSLLSVGRMRLELNLAKVALMEFDITELSIDSIRANAVSVNDSTANFLQLLPPSTTPEDTASSGLGIMPKVVLRKFSVTNNRGIRYADVASNMDCTLHTDSLELGYDGQRKGYHIVFTGAVDAQLPEYGVEQTVPYAFRGNIGWNTDNPYRFSLTDFNANVASMPIAADLSANLGDTIVVDRMNVAMGPLRYTDVAEYVPASYMKGFENLTTDFSVTAALKLVKPFRVGVDAEPSFEAEVQIPECYIQPGKSRDYRIQRFALDANLAYDADSPEKSRLRLGRCLLQGFGISLDVSGNASDLKGNSLVDTKVTGEVDFGKLVKLMPKKLPVRIAGRMKLNTALRFHLSDLNVNSFHKMQANGEVDLRNMFYLSPMDSMAVFARTGKIKFGTNSQFLNANNEMKDILMASVSLDSLYAGMPGLRLSMTKASIGAGSLGKASDLLDTTSITPIGARIKIGRLNLLSKADSSQIRVVDFESNGSIKRFKDNGKLPLLDFGIGFKRIRYSDRMTSLVLREGKIGLLANRKPGRRNLRLQARIDSMCQVYPELSRDSVVALYRSQQRKAHKTVELSEDEFVDLSLDNEFKRIFRRWNMRGEIKAKRCMLFTPYFPVRNVLKNVDMTFNMDSFNINNLGYKVGRSDMTLSGSVSNIRQTLMGSKRKPLTFTFSILSDTLDVNQLLSVAYKGSAFAADTLQSAAFNISSVDDESRLEEMVVSSSESADTAVQHAIIIPKNIAMDLKVRNKYARYSDLDLYDLRSDLMVNKGVLSLRNLAGKTTDGSMKLDMVYATASRKDIGFGMFMNLRDINVGRFLHMMPDLDTIMPMLKEVDGVINSRLAITTKVDSLMNVMLPTTNAALQIDGKDLVLLDSETFRTLSKLLLFKNKQRNVIDSLSVEVAAYDSKIDVYPFILNMDRYKLGIMGTNDFDMNVNYHISILKSPIPFKFGVNITGNVDDLKFGLGKAKLKENEVARTTAITDSTRLNLYRQMGEVFRRGAEAALRNSDMSMYNEAQKRNLRKKQGNLTDEKLTHTDSLNLIREGVIALPDSVPTVQPTEMQNADNTDKGEKKENEKPKRQKASMRRQEAVKPE